MFSNSMAAAAPHTAARHGRVAGSEEKERKGRGEGKDGGAASAAPRTAAWHGRQGRRGDGLRGEAPLRGGGSGGEGEGGEGWRRKKKGVQGVGVTGEKERRKWDSGE